MVHSSEDSWEKLNKETVYETSWQGSEKSIKHGKVPWGQQGAIITLLLRS